jgi:ribonuclease P protein component
VLPAQARLRRRPEFTTVVRSGRRVGRPTMVLHYLPDRAPGARDLIDRSATPHGPVDAVSGPRAGFVVGKAVGNSVVRHRVTRRLRAAVLQELHRLPASADLVVRARPEAATAPFGQLQADLAGGLDRVLTSSRARSS